MDNEIYDGIEWEIDYWPSVSSSGDEIGEWIHEFGATGVDENGRTVNGTAYYSETEMGFFFRYVDYEPIDEDWVDDEDYEEDENEL